MFGSIARITPSLTSAIRISRQNQSFWSRLLSTPLTRRLVTDTDGKTEKVRTPTLEEINQDQFNQTSSFSSSASSSPSNSDSSASSNLSPEEINKMESEFRKEIENLTEKVKEIDDKYKRALAEAENTRIRMKRQVDEAKIFGIQGFCKDLLEVADVLQAAIKSVPKEKLTDEHFKSLFKGVEMTENQLQSVFRRHGLNQINPIGVKFDPNEHHAMFEANDESKEPGTVAVVTQIGYKLHDRTIRPAMVGVVKARS